MTATYLAKLNTEQRRAVEHGCDALDEASPLLIIAGAGSGKTNTLANRVAHLIVSGADPRRMMLLTFSRRAAAEMQRRVRSPQDEVLGSVGDLVRSPQTDKIAYLVIAPDGSFGIDEKSVPIPLEDFKITPNANLLVLNTTKGALDAAPRVNPFTTSGIDLQSRKVDAYWRAHLSN